MTHAAPAIARKVTIAFTEKGDRALAAIQGADADAANATDAVNRAVRVYAWLLERREAGVELLLCDVSGSVSPAVIP